MVDLQEFREAMSLFATSVLAITVSDESGRPRGLVATAVCSYTVSPPTMLVSISHDSRSLNVLEHAETVGIHILDDSQDQTASILAGKGEDKFSQFAWEWEGAVPVIRDSLVTMTGSITNRFEYLDHTLFFVGLDDLVVRDAGSPLVYFQRRMRALELASPAHAA